MSPSYLSGAKGNVEARFIYISREDFETRFTDDFDSLPERFTSFPEDIKPKIINIRPTGLGLIFAVSEALDGFIEYCEAHFTPITKG